MIDVYCIFVSCVLLCKDIYKNEFGQPQLGSFYIKNIDYKCLEDNNIQLESNICE